MLLLACVGALRAWLDPGVRFGDLSLWPVAVLLLMGLFIARGNAEFTLRRRLAFLNDLNALASPRYNLGHAMKTLSEMLRAFHRADSCIVVMADGQSDGYLLWEANAEPREAPMHGERITTELAEPLLGSSPELAMVYAAAASGSTPSWAPTIASASSCARPSALRWSSLRTCWKRTLSSRCPSTSGIGRSDGYVTSRRFRYMEPDLRFLQQVIGQAALVVENIPPRSAGSEVATHERRRISRDLHDGTIQPYIGLAWSRSLAAPGSGRHSPCRGSRRPCQDGGRGHRRAAPLRRRPA